MIEIFYYSGTGFTLAAARILEEALNDEVVLTPIIGAMKSGNIKSNSKVVGFLTPMHAFGLPIAFQEFLNRVQIPDAEYVFSLVTRGGAPTKMHKEIKKYLRKKRKSLNAFKYATAPNTFDPIYEVPTVPDVIEARKDFNEDVKTFADVINNRETSIDLGYRNVFFENIVYPMMKALNRVTGYFKLQDSFYADDNCIGCGICKDMCLSGKIDMLDGKPIWRKEISCQYCLACLHLCPNKAVQVLNSKSAEYKRIHHPDAKPGDIINQK